MRADVFCLPAIDPKWSKKCGAGGHCREAQVGYRHFTAATQEGMWETK